METLINLGIIFALGHFSFSFKYDAKRYGVYRTLLLFLVSCGISIGWYFAARNVSAPGSVSFFSFTVIFVFLFHNLYDYWRFQYVRLAFISTILGVSALLGFYLYYPSSIIGVYSSVLIWGVVFSHYFFWLYISMRKFELEMSKKFLREAVIIHVVLFLGFSLARVVEIRPLEVIYSISFFYFMTLVHVVFSTFRQVAKIIDVREN